MGLNHKQVVVLREGRVAPAVRASCIGIRLGGLSSLLRLSAGDRLMGVGQRTAEEALPAIRAILGGVRAGEEPGRVNQARTETSTAPVSL